jgi:Fungal specific transcription factor domain
LLATAVRIAQALNLHVESIHPTETFFNRQMRKRLWFTICVLDVQTCIDPDSLPLIPLERTQVTLPRNVNDTDFDVSYKGYDIPEREEVTDMTFPLVIYNLQVFGRRLYYTEPHNWSAREELVASFHNATSQLTKYCNPDDSNYSWFIHYGTQSLESSVQLNIFKQFASIRNSMPLPNQEPPSLLALCSKIIENTPRIQNDERGEGFRWYVTPQWPAVVVAIRECYICTDPILVMQVWPLIEDVFEHYKKAHTGPDGRAKTRMLKKLMERTRLRVNALAQSTYADSLVPPPVSGSLPQEPGEASGDTTMINAEKQSTDPTDLWNVGWDDLINELSYGTLPGDFDDWNKFFG